MKKQHLLTGAACAGLFASAGFAQAIPRAPDDGAPASAPAPAEMAQPVAPAANANGTANGGLAEIVVTAQRRSENLQTVAIAATALSATNLAEKAVTRLGDLQFASPSLTVTDAGLTQSVNIRGIGLASGSPAVSNGVATYYDGLFLPPIASTTAFYDIGGVEVLRGPQGTLVGSNSTGGAIFINTQSPKLDQFGGYAQGSYGNYNAANLQGALNLPVSETFAARVAGNYQRHDSYFDDIGPLNNHPGRLNEKSGRVSFLWKPGAFQALYKGELTDRQTGGYAYRPILGTQYAASRVGDIRTLTYNSPTRNHERTFINSLELRYVLDNGITLRSLSGYQNRRVNNLYDIDGTSTATFTQDQYVRERQTSEEINIISPTTGAFNWILGGYYQRNKIDLFITSTGNPAPTRTDASTEKTTTGLFAQAGYHLTDKLEVQLGARYSHFKTNSVGGIFRGAYSSPGVASFSTVNARIVDISGSESDGRATGKLAFNYQLDRNNFLYVFAARGYKPGGFNSAVSKFKPETVWDYEAGWKSTFADGHIRTQIGGFWNEYHGFQFSIIDVRTGQAGVTNLPSARIRGAEGQVQLKFGGWSADFGGAYVDSRLGSITFVNTRRLPPGGNLGPQCATGVASNPPVCFNYQPFFQTNAGGPNLLSPKWTYNAGVQYGFDTGGGSTLTPRLNYAYVGPQFTSLFYDPVTDRLKARGLLSALLTYRAGQYQIEAYGTNLTNKKYVTGQTGNNEFYGAPRQYGVRASLNF
jgi:iron complex outermembrane receptor protein